MKFKIKHILLPSFLIFCSFAKLQNQDIKNDKTGFSEICLKISSDFEPEDEQGYIYNNKTIKFIRLPEFSKSLKAISKYDLDKNAKYKIEESNSGKIERIIWKSTTKGSKFISLEKLTFKTIIEQEFNGGTIRNEFTIIDYHITRNEKPKKIYFRILQNDFGKLAVDNVLYTGLFESRLLGIDDAEDEFDKLLIKK